MKLKIEVGKGWICALVKCCGCGEEFTLVRSRTLPFKQCYCPKCKSPRLDQQEDWWKGLIEVQTDD